MPNSSRVRDCGNLLLDLLPPAEFDKIQPFLETVSLTRGQLVQQFDTEITYVHFPTTALCSLLTVLQDDDPIENSTVGRGGFVGMGVALGVSLSPQRVICQMEGENLRLPVRHFLDAMAHGPVLTRLVHRYIAYSLYSTAQTLACNTFHAVEERACRWLLITHDQANRDEFPMTQEFLAFMLGVRRQSVTVVAGTLQTAGLISYRRGMMVICDRPGLERAACECYAALKDYYNRVVV